MVDIAKLMAGLHVERPSPASASSEAGDVTTPAPGTLLPVDDDFALIGQVPRMRMCCYNMLLVVVQ